MNGTLEKPIVTQHLNLVLKVSPNSKDPAVVRELLDRIVGELNTFYYQDKTGKVQVEYIEPK